jgi:hypothetical protein
MPIGLISRVRHRQCKDHRVLDPTAVAIPDPQKNRGSRSHIGCPFILRPLASFHHSACGCCLRTGEQPPPGEECGDRGGVFVITASIPARFGGGEGLVHHSLFPSLGLPERALLPIATKLTERDNCRRHFEVERCHPMCPVWHLYLFRGIPLQISIVVVAWNPPPHDHSGLRASPKLNTWANCPPKEDRKS